MSDWGARGRLALSAAWLAIKVAAVVALAHAGYNSFVYQNF